MAEREVAYYKRDPVTGKQKPVYAGPSLRQDGGLQSAYQSSPVIRPPLAAKDYLPRAAQEYFYTDPREGLVNAASDPRSPRPFVPPVSDYWSQLQGPEVDEFRRRAGLVYTTAPVIRVGDGKFVSPMEYLQSELSKHGGYRPPSMQMQPGATESPGPVAPELQLDLMSKVGKHFAGEQAGDADTQDAARFLLDTLKAHAPGGERELFPGMTEDQRQQRTFGNSVDQRYTTSENMDQNLRALSAYNLLATLDETSEHKPSYTGMDSLLLTIPANLNVGAAGAGLFNVNGNAQAMASLSKPGDPGHDIRNLTAMRWNTENPALSRIQESLYWNDLSQKAQQDRLYRDSFFGAYFPQYSWMTGQGMVNQAEMDRSNVMTRLEKDKDRYFSGLTGEDATSMSWLGDHLQRPVPVVKPGMNIQELIAMRNLYDETMAQQEQRLTNEYPRYQRTYNDWMPGTAMDVKEFSYPSPMWNNVVSAPKYWLDVPTLATLGASVPLAAAQGGLGGLAKSVVADFMRDQATTEQPFAAATYTSQSPYNTNPGMLFRPQEFGHITKEDENGNEVSIRANDPDWLKHADAYEARRADNIRKLREFQKRWYPHTQDYPNPPGTPFVGAKEL